MHGMRGAKLTEMGLENYRNGKYQRAESKLRMACTLHRYMIGASQLADIYHRNLDDKIRPPEVAAHWYLIAAESGDSDVYSYLMSIDKNIMERDDRIEIIVKYWNSFH